MQEKDFEHQKIHKHLEELKM